MLIIRCKYYLAVILLGYSLILNAQINLIPNGSFENYYSIPNGFIHDGDSISKYIKDWLSPTNGTPDFYCTKSNSTENGIPIQITQAQNYYCGNFQNAEDGYSFMGFLAGFGPKKGSHANEYLQCKLLNTLKRDHKYKLVFYINLNQCSEINLKNIGVHLAIDSIRQFYPNGYEYPNWTNFSKTIPAQIITESEESLDTGKWTRVEGIFKSKGKEQWLTFGHFFQSNYFEKYYPKDIDSTIFSYYFMDDISLVETPSIIGPDTVCFGEKVNLYSTFSGPFVWSSDSKGDNILSKDSVFLFNAIQSGWYYILTPNERDSLYVFVIPAPTVSINKDTFFCTNSNITLTIKSDASKIEWKNGVKGKTITISTAGIYKVFCANEFCISEDSVKVTEITNPLKQISDDKDYNICSEDHERIQIKLQSGYLYFWILDSDTASSKIFDKKGCYPLKIFNPSKTCYTNDNLCISEICDLNLFIPNAFAPNGINTTFKISVNQLLESKLTIFNTWGEKIFETENLNPEWDGKYNNILCPQGTYFFIFTGKSLTKKGSVEIYRKGTLFLSR